MKKEARMNKLERIEHWTKISKMFEGSGDKEEQVEEQSTAAVNVAKLFSKINILKFLDQGRREVLIKAREYIEQNVGVADLYFLRAVGNISDWDSELTVATIYRLKNRVVSFDNMKEIGEKTNWDTDALVALIGKCIPEITQKEACEIIKKNGSPDVEEAFENKNTFKF